MVCYYIVFEWYIFGKGFNTKHFMEREDSNKNGYLSFHTSINHLQILHTNNILVKRNIVLDTNKIIKK